MFKANSLSQSSLQSIQNLGRVQLVTKITQIIHGNLASNSTKYATYKIDGGQLGDLEIKLTQKHSMTKVIVVVESDAVKPIMEKIVWKVAITSGAFKLLLAFPTIIRAPVNAPPKIFTIKNANPKKTTK